MQLARKLDIHSLRRNSQTHAQGLREDTCHTRRPAVFERIERERETSRIDRHEDMISQPARAEILHGNGFCGRQGSVLVRGRDDLVEVAPDCSRGDLGLEVMRVQSAVKVAAGALLPERRLAKVADADVGEVAAEQLDALEVGREGDEGFCDAAGARPELQGPLRIWAALAVADDRGLEATGEGGEVVDVVRDVLSGDLHVSRRAAGWWGSVHIVHRFRGISTYEGSRSMLCSHSQPMLARSPGPRSQRQW